jgi:cell division protein FtsW
VIFFVAGLHWRYCATAAALAALAFVAFTLKEPYRVKRIWGFFDPKYTHLQKLPEDNWFRRYLQSSLTTRDTSYQAEMSKVAFGSGGVLGKGLGESRQKLLYLPEAHTDFILAIVGEETGLIGTMAVLAGFLIIFWRGVRTTVLAPDEFGRYLALGVTTVIVVQALINMTSVLGMMPTKGIPLPMISSGGSSLFCTLASLGILMNVSEHVG